MREEIKKALEVLKAGGTILYPTDTIWGLGCDATNSEAVEKIYSIKRRQDNKKMLVLLDNENLLERYINEVPEVAYDLIEYSEKPLTIIYQGAKNIASNLLGDNNSLGIRITREEFTSELIRQFRRPIVSTSANIHNEPFPSIFAEISSDIKDSVDYIVNWRQEDNQGAVPSGIIALGPNAEVQIIRE